MLSVLKNSWALLLGMLLLMMGNGLQGTLIGVRGEIEGFSTLEMSIVMSSYFVGFLGASRVVPEMIRRVGHVRVFAALASFISAVLVLYPAIPHPIAWSIGRVIIGFSFCGVYVTAESWLNNAATNETRGQALSVYMIAQTVGIIAAQALLLLADPAGYTLFIIISVLVSVSFAPILLSISPTPAFDTTKPMSLKNLIKTSPLGCAGMFLLGGVFAAQFGMSAIFGSKIGLSLGQISIFVSFFYIGAMLLQIPIGWLSDHMDRRRLIMICAFIGAIGCVLPWTFAGNFYMLLVAALLIGGMSNPLYSLLIAHTNDFLEYEDMAAASSGLLFINGLGAIAGPIVLGKMMDLMGAYGYFLILIALFVILGLYAIYRMTRRAAATDTTSYTAVMPTGSPVALELAQEYAIVSANEDAD
ncbi:MFS transporter [Rhodobacteraceae bacterium]|nr:MFS transporter [Paracoccaceae bacterium]